MRVRLLQVVQKEPSVVQVDGNFVIILNNDYLYISIYIIMHYRAQP